MRLLITGASGFIGGFIVEKALKEGHEVVAAIRKSSSKEYLTDERIQFIELDFSDVEKLSQELATIKEDIGNIEGVIHNAGVTKVLHQEDYDNVNFGYTKNFIEALEVAGHALRKFIYISSLAASGPGKSNTDIPISISDKNNPVTAYGSSKLRSEEYIESLENLPYIIIRPPAVFGPRDRDMFKIFDLVNKGFEIFVGVHTQYLSFVYVKDLATGIIKAIGANQVRKKYFVSDNKKYTGSIFSKLVKKSIGKKTFVIKLPIFLVYIVAFFAETFGKLTKKPSPLNVEKMNELKSSNWLCDASSFIADTGFQPQYSLEEGIQETTEWYKNNNWL